MGPVYVAALVGMPANYRLPAGFAQNWSRRSILLRLTYEDGKEILGFIPAEMKNELRFVNVRSLLGVQQDRGVIETRGRDKKTCTE